MLKPQITAAQAKNAVSHKQNKVFEIRETPLSDGNKVFDIYCIGHRVFTATSESDAEDRYYALENALNIFHLSSSLVCEPQSICIDSKDEVQPFHVNKSFPTDENDVYGIFCNEEQIYAATSKDDATDRCLTLRNAISIAPANAMETLMKNCRNNAL